MRILKLKTIRPETPWTSDRKKLLETEVTKKTPWPVIIRALNSLPGNTLPTNVKSIQAYARLYAHGRGANRLELKDPHKCSRCGSLFEPNKNRRMLCHKCYTKGEYV